MRESASSAMNAWMNSQGHKDNILADYLLVFMNIMEANIGCSFF